MLARALEPLLSTLTTPILAQAATEEGPLVDVLEIFHFTGSDPDTNRRFLIAGIGVVVLSTLFWIMNKTSRYWLNWFPGVRRKRLWESHLRGRGLGPEERTFVAALAKNAEVENIQEILRSRVSFENAVSRSQRWVDAEVRRTQILDQVRRRLSWESTPAPRPHEVVELLEHNLEVEVFGSGEHAGFCVRATLVHRDQESIVLRLEKDLENVPWDAGSMVRVYFWRENDAGYLFDASVIELRNLGEMFLFLRPPSHLERHQRRLHVRVPLTAPVTFLRIASGEAGEWLRGEGPTEVGPLRGGVIEDLSAGGFRIRVTTPLQIGDFLSFEEFPVVHGEEVLARVISERVDERSDSGYHYGAQFLGMSAAVRDQISQHIFRLQRQAVTGKEWAGPAQHRDSATSSTPSPSSPTPPPE